MAGYKSITCYCIYGLGQAVVFVGDYIACIMRTQFYIDPVPCLAPLGVMPGFFRQQGHAGDKAKGF